VETGVQVFYRYWERLDSGLRRNDEKIIGFARLSRPKKFHLRVVNSALEFSSCEFPSLPVMSLKNLLSKKRSAIVAKWADRVLDTYPLEVQSLFRQQGDPFANPVGSTIVGSLDGLFGELFGKGGGDKIRPLLEGILRIRAIQNFSPSQAVIFLPLLKGVLKEEIGEEVRQNRLHEEWLELETRIDDFLLLAFDIYMECREKIHQLRTQELRSRAGFPWPRP